MRGAPKPVKSQLPEVEEVSRQVCELWREYSPFASGVLVEFEINTLPATKRVHHKLGRMPTGWVLLRLTASTPVSFVERPGTAGSQYIEFESSLPCTAKVWIF